MAIFRNFRLSRGRAVLRRRFARMNRTKFKGNITNAKTMGLVWDATKPDDFAVLSRFHQKMHERSIDLSIISYYPGNEVPDRITAIRYLTCLKQQDLNFFYRPSSPEVEQFLKRPFDILIDTNFKDVFQLEYISCLSNAGFKVGLFNNKYQNNPFDLMLEVRTSTDIEEYLDQVIHYLEMINTGKSKIIV